jgi:peptide chain release factor 3
MELERQRGMSISSTVLHFEYRDHRINLLDTPGHKDFSEDTYRVLMAVDSVIMLIDAAAGIESQTRKLFEVCRAKQVPIFTFVNKVDRPTREPLALLDELEANLGIAAYPVTWPLGTGSEFKGVFDRLQRKIHLFDRTPGGAFRAPVVVRNLSETNLLAELTGEARANVLEELELLEHVGAGLNHEEFLAGRVTPVFFGSALQNFGVELLLDYFLEWAPPPQPRAAGGIPIAPQDLRFSGFIFKIHSNMDPRHRDRIAFFRVCSGKLVRDMVANHVRTGRQIRLANSRKFFARERSVLDEAYPGDIVGLFGHSQFQIGDTLSVDLDASYAEMPRFRPECFAYLHPKSAGESKAFRKGLSHLLEEQVVQGFQLRNAAQQIPVLAAVGPLQFDVAQHRLQAEYGVGSVIEKASWSTMRWLCGSPEDPHISELRWPSGSAFASNDEGRWAVLFPDDWACREYIRKYPDLLR